MDSNLRPVQTGTYLPSVSSRTDFSATQSVFPSAESEALCVVRAPDAPRIEWAPEGGDGLSHGMEDLTHLLTEISV